MNKKIISLFLVFCLLFPLFPVTKAAETDALEQSLAEQYDAFAASLFLENASSDALTQLLEPALSGEADLLFFGEEDPVTASVFLSDLFRTYFLEAMPQFLSHMEGDRLLAGGDIGWHDYTMDYHGRIFRWNDTPDTSDDPLLSQLFYRQHIACEPNEYDDVMTLMVGSASVRIRIEKGPVDFSRITYHLTLTVSDAFDFDGDYEDEKDQGFDTGFSDHLNDLGNIWGLHSFSWFATAGFDLQLPNSCPHDPTSEKCPLCGAAPTAPILPGDADGNGTCNYRDALLVLRATIGLETLSPEVSAACDLDGNGKLTYNDALLILRRSIGLKE